MINTIKILPQFIANRIAAGEVVGRPEAVVKELIENSIDADAINVQLIIKEAGKSLIQVIDDGTGMNEDDAALSFQRHATSKISEAEDLENISTLGFRGEALASICAVAQVELKTRTADDELGTLIKNQGNEIVEQSKVHCDTGTSVSVRNLFFNTPARRNFLKSNQTEFKHIYETFLRLAISNPSVGFRFINDEEEILDLKPADLYGRLKAIYDNDYVDSLVEVDYTNEIVSLNGFISKPSFTKKTKQDQMLFLNSRYVVSKNLSYAVHLAYGDMVEKGDYPNFFLFLNLDTRKFDVNVHPSKLEVKFDDERSVFSLIKRGVEDSLQKNDLVVEVNFETKSSEQRDIRRPQIFNTPAYMRRDTSSGNFNFTKPNVHEMFLQKENKGTDEREAEVLNNIEEVSQQIYSESEQANYLHGHKNKNTIWQFQKKYIMYQLDSVLIVIDQHAAHERILYEQALDRLNSNANLSQQLLIPLYIELNPVDYQVTSSLEKELKSLGFDIELISNRKVKLKGVPSDVKIGQEEKILQDLIDQFKEYDVKLNLEKRDNLAKSYACKHAIKAGDYLNENEMLGLLDNLFLCKMPYVCPHGRPTIVKIPIEELDKKFERT